MAIPGSASAPFLGYTAEDFVAELDSWYPGPNATILLPYDPGVEIPVGLVGSKAYLGVVGDVFKAALEVSPSGSLEVDVLKNGVSVYTISVVAGVETVDAVGPFFSLVSGDKLQLQVISVTTVTSFCLTLIARRTAI